MTPLHLRIALASLRSTRVRTILTTLGIMIGVAAITMVVSLGEGAKQTIARQIAKLDNGLIIIKPGSNDQAYSLASLNPYTSPVTSSLTERDTTTIAELPSVSLVSPLMILNGSAKGTAGNKSVSIVSTNQNFTKSLGLQVGSGQFLDPTTDRYTVVLGKQLAIDLLGTDQALGQTVKLKGREHTVIGVLKRTATPINLVGVDLDQGAFISLDDGKSFNQGMSQIQQIIVTAKDKTDPGSAGTAIGAALATNHNGEIDYSVMVGNDASENVSSFYSLAVGITTAIATISLVVGGVGIMNVMLVSVTERTREIGIRKALGATNRQIMAQFLIESLLITLVGSIIGLGIAYGLAFLVGSFLAIQPVFSWTTIATGFGMAMATGVTFGIFPALHAARKDPIQALRQYS